MNSKTARRGRPPGSGKDDTNYLRRIADRLAQNPQLKMTTAIREIIYEAKEGNESDETLKRRLQDKWKTRGAAFLTAAQERQRSEQQAKQAAQLAANLASLHERGVMALYSPGVQRLVAQVGDALTGFDRMMRTPEVRRAAEIAGAFQLRVNEMARDPVVAKWMNIGSLMKQDPVYARIGELMRRNPHHPFGQTKF